MYTSRNSSTAFSFGDSGCGVAVSANGAADADGVAASDVADTEGAVAGEVIGREALLGVFFVKFVMSFSFAGTSGVVGARVKHM
jgi:hypothetical protein